MKNGKDKISAEYAAGFFDAEGSLDICIARTGQAVLRVSIVNTNAGILRALQNKFGGHLRKPRVHKKGWKPFRCLDLANGAAGNFLRTVSPFLHIKRVHAILGIAFRDFQELSIQERCDKIPKPVKGASFRYVWVRKEETLRIEAEYRDSIALLNRKGDRSLGLEVGVKEGISTNYMAGFFDGEGCVNFTRSGSSKRLVLRTMITNTNVKVLEALQRQFGGNISHPRVLKHGWKPFRSLTLPQNASRSFLEQLAPFVYVKRKQVKLALLFLKFRNNPRKGHYLMRRGPKGNPIRKLSSCSITIERWFERRMHEFNRKGTENGSKKEGKKIPNLSSCEGEDRSNNARVESRKASLGI